MFFTYDNIDVTSQKKNFEFSTISGIFWGVSELVRARDRPVWDPDFIRKVSFSKVEMSRQCLKTCVVTER